ncbi:MAG: carboxypeptidase regulatory-like domain-containing protein, partial [Vicinamibacterales bacterium]
MTRMLTAVTLVWLLLPVAEIRAQESASSGITGRVVDSTQGALPGAAVTVINVGTGAVRSTTTDEQGRFTLANLPAATYRLRVELDGFAPTELDRLVLRLGQVASPVVTHGVATLTDTVQVEAAAPLLQTQSASVGQVIDEKQLETLPTLDRNLLNFVTLAAGVSPNLQRREGSRTWYVTVEGGRDSSTNYAIDGVYVRALRFNHLSLMPPIDSVQEVNLLRNSFSTEYGQGQAVVSMATKSGTNQLSGSLSGYFRNERFNARNYFAPADGAAPPFRRGVFGATLGGPVVRNRIFAFGSYEGGRTKESDIFLDVVPEPAFMQGNFSSLRQAIIDPLTGQPFPGNIIPASRFSRTAQIVGPMFTQPNVDGVENFRRVGNRSADSDTLTARFDEVLSANHNLFQRYMWWDSRRVSEEAFSVSRPPEGSRNLALGHTWVI